MASKDVKKEPKTEVLEIVKVASCKETYTIPKTNDTIKLLYVTTFSDYYVADINNLLVVLFHERDTYFPVAVVTDCTFAVHSNIINSIVGVVNIHEQGVCLLQYLGCNMSYHRYLEQHSEHPDDEPCPLIKLVDAVSTIPNNLDIHCKEDE